MSKFKCNACNSIFLLSKTDANICPVCGESSVILYEEVLYNDSNIYDGDSSQDLNLDFVDERETKASMFSRYLNVPIYGLIILIIIITSSLGGLACHIWTTYLVYNHWGTFLAIIAFSIPPFSELIVAVACFWWGMWFYILIIPIFIITIILFGLIEPLQEDKDRWSLKIGATVCIIIFFALCYVFGSNAWNYYKSPRPITSSEHSELIDVATSIMFVLRASTSDEPDIQTQISAAKANIRKRIDKYDETRINEICIHVNKFLIYENSAENDLTRYIYDIQHIEYPHFYLSKDTIKYFDDLPKQMRSIIGGEDINTTQGILCESLKKLSDTILNPNFNLKRNALG